MCLRAVFFACLFQTNSVSPVPVSVVAAMGFTVICASFVYIRFNLVYGLWLTQLNPYKNI
jgi:hypothetical protein